MVGAPARPYFDLRDRCIFIGLLARNSDQSFNVFRTVADAPDVLIMARYPDWCAISFSTMIIRRPVSSNSFLSKDSRRIPSLSSIFRLSGCQSLKEWA
jgi:hypothetical protein